jgi:hypothetical protein
LWFFRGSVTGRAPWRIEDFKKERLYKTVRDFS